MFRLINTLLLAQKLKTLKRLVDKGNTMIIIEHNMDVIKQGNSR